MISTLYTHSNTPMGRVIRLTTWHTKSHCAITDHNFVWEAKGLVGVNKTPYDEWMTDHKHDDVVEIPIKINYEAEMLAWLDRVNGAGYDYLELVGHVLHLNLGRRDRYTCSSLVMEAINRGKKFLAHDKYYRIQPRHVYIACYAHAAALGLLK